MSSSRKRRSREESALSDRRGPTRRILVVCPHFEPDVAPTGVVMSRIVHELARAGHEIHVVTALPWYAHHRVDEQWNQVTWRTRTQATPWGSVVRLHPRGGADKSNLLRRALGFAVFSLAAVVAGWRVAPRQRFDAVLAMSPPLTLGLAAKLVAVVRRAPLIFNVQDVFPDAAVATGAITNRWVIGAARLLEKATYRAARFVTVLSDDLHDNVAAKLPERLRSRVIVIPNFVDTERIRPGDRLTSYRSELGIGDRCVVMYAGNVGYSQSLQLMVEAARSRPGLVFVINGRGAARRDLERSAAGLANVIFGDFQPAERLSEVLATGDIHVVPLRRGLGGVSVPSKVYSILAAGRPVVAAVDPGTEVPRLVRAAQCGVVVEPDDPEAFGAAIDSLAGDAQLRAILGERARRHVEHEASPGAVAARYAELIERVGSRNGRRGPSGT